MHTLIHILRVSPHGDALALRNTAIDGVDGSEGIRDLLVVSQSLVGTWLECVRIAAYGRVE